MPAHMALFPRTPQQCDNIEAAYKYALVLYEGVSDYHGITDATERIANVRVVRYRLDFSWPQKPEPPHTIIADSLRWLEAADALYGVLAPDRQVLLLPSQPR